MKCNKTKKALELYGIIGTSLCACAGGIVGFIAGGPLVACLGVLLGRVSGHFLKKTFVNVAS